MELSQEATDKLYITEILNDLNRHGFVHTGKADTMLRDWASELRNRSRTSFPASKLKLTHAKVCGGGNW